MTKSAHTPGPWTYTQGDARNPHNACVHAADGKLVYISAALNERHKANARLISAAPELLEALEAALNCDETGGGERLLDRATLDVIRAAIAKARGEE